MIRALKNGLLISAVILGFVWDYAEGYGMSLERLGQPSDNVEVRERAYDEACRIELVGFIPYRVCSYTPIPHKAGPLAYICSSPLKNPLATRCEIDITGSKINEDENNVERLDSPYTDGR